MVFFLVGVVIVKVVLFFFLKFNFVNEGLFLIKMDVCIFCVVLFNLEIFCECIVVVWCKFCFNLIVILSVLLKLGIFIIGIIGINNFIVVNGCVFFVFIIIKCGEKL